MDDESLSKLHPVPRKNITSEILERFDRTCVDKAENGPSTAEPMQWQQLDFPQVAEVVSGPVYAARTRFEASREIQSGASC